MSVYLVVFTFAISCFIWPPELDWAFRKKMWPDRRAVTTIKDLGFNFVPKNQENDKSKLTWWYYFSLAERKLPKEVNESVDHLKPTCKRLKGCHFKTILFRTLEVTSAKMWCEKNILDSLDYLLKELQEVFHQQRCMHFWIGHINLFQDFNHHRLSNLNVKEIRKNPVPSIFTYIFHFTPSCPPFTKNEKQLSCFCFALLFF